MRQRGLSQRGIPEPAVTLSSYAEGILLVTRPNIVRRPMLDELRWQLKASAAPKLEHDATRSGDAVGYGNGSGYPYGYGSATRRKWRRSTALRPPS